MQSDRSDARASPSPRIYEAIVKVCVGDESGRRARDIADGIGYACALLKDEYGWDVDAIVGLLEQIMSDVEDSFSADA